MCILSLPTVCSAIKVASGHVPEFDMIQSQSNTQRELDK